MAEVQVPEFPDYYVREDGMIFNAKGDVLTPLTNGRNIVFVNFYRLGVKYNRSISRIVAEAFLPTPENDLDNTPINLDGDRSNCAAYNLAWRPRWFAILYMKQFSRPPTLPRTIVNVRTGQIYRNSLEASASCGALQRSVYESIRNRTPAWPTEEVFAFV